MVYRYTHRIEPEPISAEVLERWIDRRSTDELLRGIPNISYWGDIQDNESDWWKSPRNYPFYAGLSSYLRPSSVLEIGVRFGYSLVSMHRGFPWIRRILGIDNQADRPESQRKAMENLVAAGYKGALRLPVGDSSLLDALPADETFDLIHVDGNHDQAPVEKDILAVWPRLNRGGFLVVDDADYCPPVRAACEAVRLRLPHLVTFFFFPTFRGWLVAKKA